MKIAISGTHGSGKSTVLERLTEAPPTVTAISEVPRTIIAELNDARILARGRTSPALQCLLIGRQMALEGSAGGSVPIVTDRSVLDHWAYTRIHFPEWCTSPEGRAWFTAVRQWSQTYTCIILLPMPPWGSPDDGVREADIAFQREVSIETERVLDECRVRYLRCVDLDIEQRVALVRSVITR